MSTAYEDIESSIASALTAEGTPFTVVRTFGASMPDREIGEQLEGMAKTPPAALVFYAGGELEQKSAGEAWEQATFTILLIAATATREGAGAGTTGASGIYDLLAWTLSALNGLREEGGPLNELYVTRHRRWAIPGLSLGVATYAVDCTTIIVHA